MKMIVMILIFLIYAVLAECVCGAFMLNCDDDMSNAHALVECGMGVCLNLF